MNIHAASRITAIAYLSAMDIYLDDFEANNNAILDGIVNSHNVLCLQLTAEKIILCKVFL